MSQTVSPDRVQLRPVTAEDDELLLAIYTSTRDEQLRQMGWAEEHIRMFVKMQWEAQTKHYRTHFTADEYIVLVDLKPVGRIIVQRSDDEILLVDMAVLTEHRNKNIGSHLMRSLTEESDSGGKPIRLHVLKFSPAVRFYERFGFTKIREDVVNFEMQRQPLT